MVKSLGEFNISLSSSADIHNITWSQRNLRDTDIPKKKNVAEKFQNASATICKIEQGFKRKGR